jgi:hypothetical protein
MLELIAEINKRDLLNTLTDAGLIPNYAFPEAGIELKSVLWRKRGADEQGQGAFVALPAIKYERPANSALSEFAPENRFYANQRRVEIDQINMNLAKTEDWRFCPSCHHMQNLAVGADSFPDPRLAATLKLQLKQYKLADEDIDLMLCLSHLIGRGLKQGGLRQLQEPTFYQSVFVDEVQDFTEQQVYLMVEQANPKYKAVTVVGDTAQKLHHGSTIDLRSCFPGQAVSHVRLTENLRQANMPGLALFSASFRSVLQGDEPPNGQLAAKARGQGNELVRPKFTVCESEELTDSHILETLIQAKRSQTVAVLFPDTISAEKVYKRLEHRLRENLIDSELSEKMNLARRHIRHFADVAKSKGLEFDVVMLVGIDSYDLENASHVNRLYVGITRARTSLVLLSASNHLAPSLVKVRNLYQSLVGLPAIA